MKSSGWQMQAQYGDGIVDDVIFLLKGGGGSEEYFTKPKDQRSNQIKTNQGSEKVPINWVG